MKTIIKIFICLSLMYTPIFANASNVGGWNLSNPVAQGASTVYDATKNVLINGKDFVKKSTVKITPTVKGVSKVLAGGAAGYALSIAVEQLLGSVDWVLDPANNRIVYTETNPENVPKIWVVSGSIGTCNNTTPLIGDISTAFAKCIENNQTIIPKGCTQESPTQYTCYYQRTWVSESDRRPVPIALVNNPAYDPSLEEEEKYLPLDAVASQVISNAETDTDLRPAAQVATTAAAADIVAEAETDNTKARPIVNQAEANAETKPADEDAAANANSGTATATPQADPVTGEQAPPTDIALEFPVFCNWAPTICEAAQVIISFPDTLAQWWLSVTEWFDWTKEDFDLPEPEPNEILEIETPELTENAISWGASCPSDVSIPISMQGVSSTLVFSWSPWCQLLSIIKPAIIASAYIGAAFIVLGLRT